MELLGESFPMLLRGLWMTLMLGVVSFVIGSILGIVIAMARRSGPFPVRIVMWTYVAVFRGTPLLIQVFLIYFGLPQLGVDIPAIQSAILAFSLNAAAYLSEIFRAGIAGVEKGQWEAAQSLGMSNRRILRRVIFPQAVRLATPAVGGQFIYLIKDTALASVITVVELTRVAESAGTASFQYMQAFLIAAGAYLLINTVLTLGQGLLERRMEKAYA